MPKFLYSSEADFTQNLDAALHYEAAQSPELEQSVRAIIKDVRANGDSSLLEYTNKWDRTSFKDARELKLSDAPACSQEVQEALEFAAARIRSYHEQQIPKDYLYTDKTGTELGWKWTAIKRVGLYVPGGKANYPSSVLMNAIPALTAGVQELVMVVPTPDHIVNPAIIAAAKIAGITEIYAIGGAQAIAALAYGTESIQKVDKIVGPGNAYVAEAKRQVFGTVGIDMIAGPSEILVLADETANPQWVAADLLSQAEHDEEARPMLVTHSPGLAKQVAAEVETLLGTLSRKEIAQKAWEANGLLITTQSEQESIEVANKIATEHLEIITKNPKEIAERIHNAGAIFLGGYTPEPIGDYVAGPSHVLPTSGTARFSSGLSVYDFLKRSSIIQCSKDSFNKIGKSAEILAEEEGLTAHKLSVSLRKNQ